MLLCASDFAAILRGRRNAERAKTDFDEFVFFRIGRADILPWGHGRILSNDNFQKKENFLRISVCSSDKGSV